MSDYEFYSDKARLCARIKALLLLVYNAMCVRGTRLGYEIAQARAVTVVTRHDVDRQYLDMCAGDVAQAVQAWRAAEVLFRLSEQHGLDKEPGLAAKLDQLKGLLDPDQMTSLPLVCETLCALFPAHGCFVK